MTLRPLIFLPILERLSDLAVLALRVLTGAFLIYGVIDNVMSAERMEEFVQFMAANGFAMPELMAPLSVYAQLVFGLLFVLGLFTRWAGLGIAFNFIVGVVMVHWAQDFRGWWPAIVLVFIGFQYAALGGGRYSLDRMFSPRA